ncbi:hypothetical protein EC973_003261 [Apophysomyces ossiformis]|uniref:GCS light chain n=1 Tax=Apophysomyces ossiformis TaxID=679940 RepID=A0A8H7BWR4_9FUNG|nr:hypothetical protein EC973_003261 [Apophysomyces ossiformis]
MPAQTILKTDNIPSFKHIVLYTGNVMRTGVAGGLHKKAEKELITAIDDTLRNSLRANTPSFRYYSEDQLLEVPDLRLGGIAPEDRGNIEVTVKLFYLHQNDSYPASQIIDDALRHLQKILRVSLVDTFILSSDVERTKALWPLLEAHQNNGSVGKLGLTDFTHADLFDFLHDPNVKIKPKINQITVGQCCNMPTELMGLAKQSGVELLHNGDSADILTTAGFSSLLRSHGVIDKANVSPLWAVKYHVFENSRSVVTDKG